MTLFVYLKQGQINSNIELEGYSNPIHSFRRFKHRRAGRLGGGLIIYIKERCRRGGKIIQYVIDCLIWLKLDKVYFQIEKDVYLVFTYIVPRS